MCELTGRGKVVSVDIEKLAGRPEHRRITYIHGSSVSAEVITQVRQRVEVDDKVMVVLDSDHTKKHVMQELEIYKEFVSQGSYMIVEDSNINGHPVLENFGSGPMEALDEFLIYNKEFVIDESKEKFYLTFSPRGFLLRK